MGKAGDTLIWRETIWEVVPALLLQPTPRTQVAAYQFSVFSCYIPNTSEEGATSHISTQICISWHLFVK